MSMIQMTVNNEKLMDASDESIEEAGLTMFYLLTCWYNIAAQHYIFCMSKMIQCNSYHVTLMLDIDNSQGFQIRRIAYKEHTRFQVSISCMN